MKHKAQLLLGGNIGDIDAYLAQATERIDQICGKVTRRSRAFRSEPWGMIGANWFINLALEVETELEPEELLRALIDIEHELGREREKSSVSGYSSRTIDIDILYYDQFIHSSNTLTIPHPRLHLRRFALTCMVDLDARRIHPKLMKTQRELLADCTDQSKVELT